jgi:formamidopyrimidine-DNA glycosylase
MPELPEVETIVKTLREGGPDSFPLIGHKIRKAHLLWQRTLAAPDPAEFKTRITGQIIRGVRRRGKYLLFDLSEDTLLIHLRMTGDLVIESGSQPPAPHHRLMLDLDGGARLSFNDTRKFGRVWLTDDPSTVLGNLGPEPLDPSFTPRVFFDLLQPRRRQIKPMLLDQTFIAGMGNIYTDEALHLAKIHPLTLTNQLDYPQVERLWNSIRQVLREGILRNGTSIDWVYRGGDYQKYLRVYQRNGEPCMDCGTTLERMVVGQRSTHFCPSCQQLPDPSSSHD